MMTDADIVTAVLAGRRSEFAELVDRYLAMVRGLCASHVRASSAHDDLVQETFTDGYLKLSSLRQRDRFGPWLAAIARNKCISWIRSETRRTRAHEAMATLPAETYPPPSDAASREELHRFVQAQIAHLPERTREAMALCYVEGLSIRDAARFLDASEAALKKRLQYGRQLISDSLWKEIEGRQRPEQTSDQLKRRVLAAIPLTAPPVKVGLGAVVIGYVSGVKATALVCAMTSVLVLVLAMAGYHWRDQTGSTLASNSSTTQPVISAFGESYAPDIVTQNSHEEELPVQASILAGQLRAASVAPWTANASGVVVDEAQNPQAGVVVTFVQSPERRPGLRVDPIVVPDTTDRNGRFFVHGLSEGTYAVTARQSYVRRSATQRIAVVSVESAKGSEEIVLVLKPNSGATIAGTVSNRSGAPVAGAHVWVDMLKDDGERSGKCEAAVTGVDGHFEIGELADGRCRLTVSHRDYSLLFKEGLRSPYASVNLVLEALGTIEGRVLDAGSGKPIHEFGIWAYAGELRGGIQSWMLNNLQEFRNIDGAFRLEKVDAGLDSLIICAKGYAPKHELVSVVPPDGILSNVDIQLMPGAIIAGRVIGANDNPLSGAKVYAEGIYSCIRPIAVSGADGEFTIDSIGFDEMNISASYPGYFGGGVRVVPNGSGSTPVTIHLHPGGTVEGIIRKGGLPLEGVTVAIETAQTTSNSSGFYRMEGVTEGSGSVMLWTNVHGSAEPNSSSSRKALVRAGEVTQVDFDLPDGAAAIEGTITLNGLAGAAIHVDALAGDTDGTTWRYDALVDKTGYYHLENLPEGVLTLHVDYRQNGRDYARIAKVLTGANETTHLDIELTTGGRITGVVQGLREGEHLSVVALWSTTSSPSESLEEGTEPDEREIAGFASTGADGSFEIVGLDGGVYTVVASARNADPGSHLAAARVNTVSAKVPVDGEARADLKLP